jgi:mRNA-degrading endonuclease toxin of MazEF toxin-antitoxin module
LKRGWELGSEVASGKLQLVSRETFIGIPLTTKLKRGSYFFKFQFIKNLQSVAVLSQIRTFDQKRLIEKIGEISPTEFAILKRKLRQLFK